MLDRIVRLRAPALYQGGDADRRYFEGWYFKAVGGKDGRAVAAIPGVSFSEDGRTAQSFVQIIQEGGGTRFFSYPAAAFSFARRPPFAISVAGSTFTEQGMSLDLRDAAGEVRGHVGFGPWSPWPVTTRAPGIMGWYRYVPRMECYHGVLSMDHAVDGRLTIDGEQVDFGGGRGYIEKDWGRSFPSSWIWAQANHFARPGVSLTCSVAKIPWISGGFVGHIAGLLVDGRLLRFATYTGAWLAELETGPGSFRIVLRDHSRELEVRASGGAIGALKAPVLGAMEGRADEAMGGSLWLRLRELRGLRAVTVFEGAGAHTGIEVMNARAELVVG
jgi:hypothetical protein